MNCRNSTQFPLQPQKGPLLFAEEEEGKMAILELNNTNNVITHSEKPSFSVDDLYCEEEKWGDVEEDEEDYSLTGNGAKSNDHLDRSSSPLVLLEQDLYWEDEELLSLFSKEKETHVFVGSSNIEKDPILSAARREAVDWIVKVNAVYRFSALTVVLAINYLDRFLCSLDYQKDKPWMIQLASVTCLSLAAKVEEINVPLLLDLQVVDSKYAFEAKTIQKMELLILSTLKWRMNAVTPLSFLDHIIRRLGLKSHLHWEFLMRCESLLLSVLADSRVVRYMPSVLACSTMLHAIHQVDPCNATDYQNQLLNVLNISKKKVNECYELISELTKSHKRKFECDFGGVVPCSPNGVMDAFFSSDSSNDSWVTMDDYYSSVSSSPEPQPLMKRSKIGQEQKMRLPSLSRVFVDIIGSPR